MTKERVDEMETQNHQLVRSPRKANGCVRHLPNVVDDIRAEPDLNAIVNPEYKFTYGDLKKQAQTEAQTAWECGRYSLSDNPFIEGSWSHKWWHDEYARCDV